MPVLFWDASALAKRYFAELGSDTVDEIFRVVPPRSFAAATIGYAETYSILHRRANGGAITLAEFRSAEMLLADETVDSAEFRLFHPSEEDVFGSLTLIHRHNLNSTDAVLLSLLLAYTKSLGAERVVVIAADRRLLRAAAAEGLATLNPEEVAAGDVAELISSL